MPGDDRKLTSDEASAARLRRDHAMSMQAIEGNPLDETDIAMFEMFERERWSHARCREHILANARIPASAE
ncbi:MAG: hypothetical protein AB7P02_11165 [Alphaproteobacteria bacterium]